MSQTAIDVARDCVTVTPNDTTVFSPPLNGLYIGTAGTGALTVVTGAGNTVAFASVTAGLVIPIQVSQVKATGTGASNIVGLK